MDYRNLSELVFKREFRLTSHIFYYISLLIIAIITFYPLLTTGIASADDMANYINTLFGKEFSNAKDWAEYTGRFYYLVVGVFHNLSYEIDDQFVIKLFQIIPIVVCLYLFYRIVLILTNSKEISSLFVLLFFVIAQVSPHTSLFVTYPFYFTFSFSIILSAYLLLHRFQVSGKKRYLIASGLFFGFGLLFYEVYILFIGFALLSVIYHNFREGKRGFQLIKNMVLQTSPYVLVVVAYFAAYIIYRNAHPTEYAGTTMGGGTLTVGTFFQVLWNLSYTAFPLTSYDTLHSVFDRKSELVEGYRNVVPYLFAHAHAAWIVKGILVFILGYLIMLRIPRVSYKVLLLGFLFSVMFTFFPHIPLAVTSKYIYYVTKVGMLGYVTTFFSLFGVVLFLAILSSFLLNFTRMNSLPRHGIALVISVAFVFCSFLTDFSNYYVTKDMHQANTRLRAVEEMIKSDQFKSLPLYSNIYAAELWNNPYYMAGGMTEQGFQWTYYILGKSGIQQLMIRDDKEFLKVTKASTLPGYRIVYKQAMKTDDAMIVLAQLDQPAATDTLISNISNKLIVVYYSTCKQFSVSFKRLDAPVGEKTKIKIAHLNDEIDPGNYVEFSIYNTKTQTPATIFTIEAPFIDIRSIRISNLAGPDGKVFYL